MNELEKAKNKSIGNQKKVPYIKLSKEKYINKLKKSFISGAIIAGLTLGVAYLGSNTLEGINNYKEINNQLESSFNIVNENTKRTKDNKNFYYDESNIANELANDYENLDMNLFGVYKKIGYDDNNKKEEMNEIIDRLDLFLEEEQKLNADSFDQYLINKGFVDKKGEVDYKEYNNSMKNFILNQNKLNELENEIISFKQSR